MRQQVIESTIRDAIIEIIRLGEKSGCSIEDNAPETHLCLNSILKRGSYGDNPVTIYRIERTYWSHEEGTYEFEVSCEEKTGKSKATLHDLVIKIPQSTYIKAKEGGVSLEYVKEKIISCFNDSAEHLRDFSGHPVEEVDEKILEALGSLIKEWMLPDDRKKACEMLGFKETEDPEDDIYFENPCAEFEIMEPMSPTPNALENLERIKKEMIERIRVPGELIRPKMPF